MLCIFNKDGRSQPLLASDSFFPEASVRIVTRQSPVNLKVIKNQLFFDIFFTPNYSDCVAL